jgi:hypothetical protein
LQSVKVRYIVGQRNVTVKIFGHRVNVVFVHHGCLVLVLFFNAVWYWVSVGYGQHGVGVILEFFAE